MDQSRSTPRRYFVGAATATYAAGSGLDALPELAHDVEQMADLFSAMGYQRVGGFGLDLPSQQLRRRLRAFLIDPAREPDDIVAVYYAGHGDLDENDLLLPMVDTTDDRTETSLWAEDLTTKLLRGGVRVSNILFILDTCYASAGGGAMAHGAVTFINRLYRFDHAPSVAIVVSARPYEQAGMGAFTSGFAAAIGTRAVGGNEPAFLPLDSLVNLINANSPSWQHARLFYAGEGLTQFIPNPRFNHWFRDVDLRTRLRLTQQALRAGELTSHVLPRAQGHEVADGEGPWLFTGRQRALAEVCRWLADSQGTTTLVVTGDPGSGKSALLSRLFVLSDPRLRSRVPALHLLVPETLPPVGAMTRFIHARGKTPPDLLSALAEACGIDEAASPGEIAEALRGRTTPVVVVIDAIDEAIAGNETLAAGLFPPVDEVLAPLIRFGERTALRLLLGTRRHLVPRLDTRRGLVRVIDLDADEFFDPQSVRSYAAACLIDLTEDSLYRHQPRSYVEAVAGAIAGAARRSFLVALITARSHALHRDLPDPTDPGWAASLPKAASEAMRRDLEQRLGQDELRARDLLLPLSYAFGTGLPWEDFWPELAAALSGRSYANTEIDWLIDQAGYYIVESIDNGRSTYRLFHEALALYLQADRDHVADHAAFVDISRRLTPRTADGHTDWAIAHPYIRNHLATHAAEAKQIDQLATDPRFLLAAAPAGLLTAFGSTLTTDAYAAADAYRRALALLHRAASHQQEPAYLLFAAKCAMALQLAEAIAVSRLRLDWATSWVAWRDDPRHRAVGQDQGSVRAATTVDLGGRSVLVTATEDHTLRVWDLTTGVAVGEPLTGHTGAVLAVTASTLAGACVIVSASADRTVRVWDLASGVPIGQPLLGHHGAVTEVANAGPDEPNLIVTASHDGTLRLWDITTGEEVWAVPATHCGPVQGVAIASVAGRREVVSVSGDDRLHRWELATGIPITDPLTLGTDPVRAIAVAEYAGATVLLTVGVRFGIRMFDLTTGSAVGPGFHGPTNPLNALIVGRLAGRQVVAAAGVEATVWIWDVATGHLLGDALTVHSRRVRAVAVANLRGRSVAVSGSDDLTVRAWDVGTGRQIGTPFVAHYRPIRALLVTEVNGQPVIVTGSDDHTIRTWDLATGTEFGDPMTGHEGSVRGLALANLGMRPVVISASEDATIRVWDLAQGTQIGRPLIGHTSWVHAVAVVDLAGRPAVISASDDQTLRIWDLTDGRQLGEPLTGHTNWVHAVAVAELDGRPIAISASGDTTLRKWDLMTHTQIGDPLTGHTAWVRAVTVTTHEGRTVAVSASEDASVRIWDLADGSQFGTAFTWHRSSVNAVAVAELPQGPVAVTASDDRTVQMWALSSVNRSAEPSAVDDGVASLAIANLGGRAAVVLADGGPTMNVWDLSIGRLSGNSFSAHTQSVNALAMTEMSSRPMVISASTDRTIRIWDLHTGAIHGEPITGHAGPIRALAIASVGARRIVVSGGDDRVIRLWDLGAAQWLGLPMAGHMAPIRALAVTAFEGRTVVISASEDATVRLWDLTDGRPIGGPLVGHSGAIRAVVPFRWRGRVVVVSAGYDATLQMWDLASGTRLGSPMTGHSRPVSALAVARDNSERPLVISGSEDRSIRLWDLASKPIANLVLTGHTRPVNAAVVTSHPTRPVLLTAGHDGTLRSWDLLSANPTSSVWPACIDFPCALTAVVANDDAVVVAGELGLACLRVTAK